MIKVSIIIPVYNAYEKVKRCIESVINQTYKNIEIILIDDGSFDDSFSILEDYANKYSFIKAIRKENEGVAITRNKGITIATGDYIMFVDNDDYIDCDYVLTHVNYVMNKDLDIVLSGYKRVNDKKTLFKCKLKDTYWSRYIVMAPWAKLYKKDFLIKNNISFLDYPIGEDVYFNLISYSYKPKILITDYIGYNWYFNNKSVSNTTQKGLNEKTDILYLLEQILQNSYGFDIYQEYYFNRYYIWYLLFSGKYSFPKQFVFEHKRIKNWFKSKNIKLSLSPFSNKLKGESIKNRLIVFIFILLEKLNLIKLFAKIYCKKS